MNTNQNIITESDMQEENTDIIVCKDNDTGNILTPESIEVREALKPTDVVLDWDGYFWPLIKKLQYTYRHDSTNSNCVEFTLESKDAPRNKIPKEYYERLRQIYVSAGWEKCVIDLNSSTSTTYIRLYRKI